MRLLFLSDHLGYADGVVHGATTYFLNVLGPLTHAGVDVHVCFLRDRHPAAQKLEAAGIRPVFLNRHKWDPRALTDLIRIIRKHDIQLVHAAGMKGILLGRMAARLKKCKVIIHLHDTNSPGAVLGWCHRRMAKWTDLCLTVSDAVGELARTEFGMDRHQVLTLHNCIALNTIANVPPDTRSIIRQEFDLPEDAPVIGVVGRLSPEKGHDALLHAMAGLRETHPRAHLLIVGDGPTRPACERLIAKLGLDSVVRVAGFRSDISAMLAAIDVFVLPSYREGLSYSTIEAMAVGRPVVASAVDGLFEVVAHGKSGLLVPPRDTEQLAAAIRRVLDDPELSRRLVSNARQSVRRFSIEAHIERLVAEYRRLIGCAQCSHRCAVHSCPTSFALNSHTRDS